MKSLRDMKDESGSVLVLTALSFAMLTSFLAIAIDIGSIYESQRQLQTLADSAAMAAALEVNSCGATHGCAVMQTAATTALTEGGTAAPAIFLQCAAASGTGLLLTINNGPCSLGATDPNNGNTNYVEAVVTENKPTYFARVFGISTVLISARAEAGTASSSSSGPCFDVTGTSGQTLTLNSGASITDGPGSNCGVQVNSSGTPAVMEDSGATVNVGSYNVHGAVTNNGGTYTPAPTTGAPAVSDPFAAEISAGTLSTPPQGATQSVSTVSGTTTLSPGYYPNGINFNGSGYTVTLDPGVYFMGGGINVGGVTLNGTGVTIYMASGQLNMNSASNINLTAPATGDTAGLVIWQPASNTSQMNLDSASSSSWAGGIYLPSAQLTLNGGSTATAYGSVVAQSVMVNSAISLSCSSMPGGTCPGGSGGSGNGSTSTALAE
jgi:Flp pilus assembly protein TadG